MMAQSKPCGKKGKRSGMIALISCWSRCHVIQTGIIAKGTNTSWTALHRVPVSLIQTKVNRPFYRGSRVCLKSCMSECDRVKKTTTKNIGLRTYRPPQA